MKKQVLKGRNAKAPTNHKSKSRRRMSAQGPISPKSSSNKPHIENGKDLVTSAATRARVSVDVAHPPLSIERLQAEIDRALVETNRTPRRLRWEHVPGGRLAARDEDFTAQTLTDALLKMGVNISSARPFNPWYKPAVERFFVELNRVTLRHIPLASTSKAR